MVSQQETVKAALNMSLKAIRMYEWLLDLYVLDFFVDNHWEKLPATWRDGFKDMDPQTLGDILSGNLTHNKVLPLSFLALLNTVKALTLPRNHTQKIFPQEKELVGDTCNTHTRLKNLFLKHVKLKKRHEISLMAEVVNDTALRTNCNAVLDFGSGLGHLLRVLAYKYDLNAAGIESQTQLTQDARKLDIQLEYTASKHLSPETISKFHRPIHYNITLKSPNQLHKLLPHNTMKNYGLVGLHPCGDLGPLLLRSFVQNEQVKFICIVGCCFMKISCNGESNGYPMSAYVEGLDSKLSFVSREIACHAIEVYCDRLKNGNYHYLKVHAYRAALEKILVDFDPNLKHSPVRSIKHSESMNFERYYNLAVKRLTVPLPSDAWTRGLAAMSAWHRVVIVYTLRLALAPLVETVVLLDRVLYVLEQGLTCEIRPVFDPKLSPRNHIIIAKR